MPTARRLMIGKHDCPDDVTKDDYDSLVQIYNLLHGPTWGHNKGWLVECSCGKWENVIVKNRRVVTLFSNYGTHPTPSDITGWILPTGLEILDFKWVRNHTGDIRNWILPTTLKKLDISSSSGITSDISGWVLPPKLEIINLTNSGVTGDISRWVLPQTLLEFSTTYGKVSGDISAFVLPPKLTKFSLYRALGLSGDITGWILPVTLTTCDIGSTQLAGNIGSWVLPPNLESISISNLGTVGDISSWVLPSTLVSIALSDTQVSCNMDSWILPASLITFRIDADKTAPGLTLSGIPDISNAINITAIDLRNAHLSQSSVDGILATAYAIRNTHVKSGATPAINLSGVISNSSPSGVFQASATPSTGKEYAFALVNDPNGEGFKKWAITTN